MAVDMSSHKTGVAVVDDKRRILFDTEIDLKSANIETRIGKLYAEMTNIIEHCVTSYPEQDFIVVLEQARRSRFQAVYAALRCAQAAVWCACHGRDIPIRYVAPIQIRAALGLPSKASKDDLRKAVEQKFGMLDTTGISQDLIDALGIAEAYLQGLMVKSRKIGRVYSETKKGRKK